MAFYSGPDDDISWAHATDKEFQSFTEENAGSGGALLFGRKTYEMMIRYWPTPQAAKENPIVAERMNSLPKFVFSRILSKADWQNTNVLKGELESEVRKLKEVSWSEIVILGSGSIVTQLVSKRLIDRFQIVIYYSRRRKTTVSGSLGKAWTEASQLSSLFKRC